MDFSKPISYNITLVLKEYLKNNSHKSYIKSKEQIHFLKLKLYGMVPNMVPKGYFTCQKTKNPSRRGVLRVVPPVLITVYNLLIYNI